MSTLQHLDMALVNIRERLTNELQFSVDAERQINHALDTVNEALADLSRCIKNGFAERHRALASAIGTPGPAPETLDQPAASDHEALPAAKKRAA